MLIKFRYEFATDELPWEDDNKTKRILIERAWTDLQLKFGYLLDVEKEESSPNGRDRWTGRVVVLHQSQYKGIMKMLDLIDMDSVGSTMETTNAIREELTYK